MKISQPHLGFHLSGFSNCESIKMSAPAKCPLKHLLLLHMNEIIRVTDYNAYHLQFRIRSPLHHTRRFDPSGGRAARRGARLIGEMSN